jgi:hypothetical protein
LVQPPLGNQHGPYLLREQRDLWNNSYIYKVLPTGGFKISSAGPDGIANTADDITQMSK